MKKNANTTSGWSAPARVRRREHGAEPITPPRILRLAYLTTEYPAVSHTFIRREIVELDRRGHHVARFAIRRSQGELVDPSDRAEAERTRYVLPEGTVKLLVATLFTLLASPARWFKALRMSMTMSRRSDRGAIVHLAYLVEACWLHRQLRREGIDYLHVHFGTNAAAVARLVRALGGPKFSMTVHGPGEFDAPVGLSLGDKAADAAAVMAITHYCAAQLRRWIDPVHWSRIHVVRCAPGEVGELNPAPVSETSDTLVCIGRLTAQKGQLLLVDAMRALADEGIPGRLILAGDGEMRGAIEKRISQLGIADRIEITGWVTGEQVRTLLRDSRAMVLPSFAEGLPVVIMEAFAMARPVVSTFVAGIPELIEPGVNGWLTPAGDLEALTSAMRSALTAPASQLTEMGRTGHARVREQHDLVTEVNKLESIISGGV